MLKDMYIEGIFGKLRKYLDWDNVVWYDKPPREGEHIIIFSKGLICNHQRQGIGCFSQPLKPIVLLETALHYSLAGCPEALPLLREMNQKVLKKLPKSLSKHSNIAWVAGFLTALSLTFFEEEGGIEEEKRQKAVREIAFFIEQILK